MSKHVFPKKIADMISTRRAKGLTSKQIAQQINVSTTAKKLGVEYSYRSIAAKMANLTMDELYR